MTSFFKPFDWIKNNKLLILLIIVIVIVILIFKKSAPSTLLNQTSSLKVAPRLGGAGLTQESYPSYEAAPAPEVKDRLVIKQSYLSLLVNNVTQTQKEIVKKAESFGGYMVNSNLENPQDIPTGNVIVRIPVKKLEKALEYFRSLAIKVVSENLEGYDVTDEYVDVEARMANLLKTKNKLEEVLEKATGVQDIMSVQQQLINLQSQIDSLKGQENYLKKSAQMAKIVIYLSTDESSLPYAPREAWRPAVVFKEAVRSLILTLRKVGTLAIWLAVYSIIWVPVVIIIHILKQKRKPPHK